MNKKAAFINAAVLAIMGVASQGALAADGTINFTGSIVDQTCSISPNSQNLQVPLGNVTRTSLDGAAGKKSTPAKFTINLLGCGATAKNAQITFSGPADNDNLKVNPGTAAATAASNLLATGVAVELEDSNGAKIALGQASAAYALTTGDNALQFQAVYVTTGTKVTSGIANATAQFTVSYN